MVMLEEFMSVGTSQNLKARKVMKESLHVLMLQKHQVYGKISRFPFKHHALMQQEKKSVMPKFCQSF
jgi:hypothetical protein